MFIQHVTNVVAPQPMPMLADGAVLRAWMHRRLCSLMERCSIFGAQVSYVTNIPAYTCTRWWNGAPCLDAQVPVLADGAVLHAWMHRWRVWCSIYILSVSFGYQNCIETEGAAVLINRKVSTKRTVVDIYLFYMFVHIEMLRYIIYIYVEGDLYM